MEKGSKVIKVKHEKEGIFVGTAWGRKRTRWGRKGAGLALKVLWDYFRKRDGEWMADVYLDEMKGDLLRLIRQSIYQQAMKDGKKIEEYDCSFEGVFLWPQKNRFICFNFGNGAILGKTKEGHIGSLILSEKRIRKEKALTADGAVSEVGLKRGKLSDYCELYVLEGRQERWAMSIKDEKIEEGKNPLFLSIKSC